MVAGGGAYDPFAAGPWTVETETVEAADGARRRVFPCDVWRAAAAPGKRPLVVFSHHSGGNRRSATFLFRHLASHGYLVAAIDHSETVAPELARREGETAEQREQRIEGWISSRVPDMRFLLDTMLRGGAADAERVGIAGHSFGGWTALAATEVDRRIRAVAAFAPGGASNPKPGILRLRLDYAWGRDVPALYLAAENDAALPLDGTFELFERTPGTKRMAILRRADHMHFLDDVEKQHEFVRTMPATGDLAKIQQAMRPIAELCAGEQAHLFVRGLTLAHFDDSLMQNRDARRFLDDDAAAALAARGVDAEMVTGRTRLRRRGSVSA